MFDPDELNEVATLLHITSEIVQNHPNLQGIGRACMHRLNEIEADMRKAEAQEVEASKQREAKRQAEDYKQPKPGDPGYVKPEEAPKKVVTPPEGPANSAVERPGGTIQRLSTDKRTEGEKLLDQPVEELPKTGEPDPNGEPSIDRRV